MIAAKMKILLLSLSAFTVCFFAEAQVPNGGFEDMTALPSTTGQWSLAEFWFNANSNLANPDLFHTNGGMGGDLPETPIALVDPFEGSAVMGIVATGVKGTDFREYLSVPLEEPLVIGQKYTVSFHYCNGYITQVSQAGLGTSDFGVAFTSSPPQQSGTSPMSLNPQFKHQGPLFSREWDNITFSFVADQAHEYMTIGVFGDDTDKDIVVFDNSNPQLAYYFLDDFSIMEVETSDIVASNDNPRFEDHSEEQTPEPAFEESPFFIPNAFTPNGDGDNDVFAPVVADLSNYEFCIFSRWGELIFKTTAEGEGWSGHSVNGAMVDVGMYVWELSYTRTNEDGKTVRKSHRGTVNLIR